MGEYRVSSKPMATEKRAFEVINLYKISGYSNFETFPLARLLLLLSQGETLQREKLHILFAVRHGQVNQYTDLQSLFTDCYMWKISQIVPYAKGNQV